MNRSLKLSCWVLCAAVLAGCGGGGEGDAAQPALPGKVVAAASMNAEDLNTILFQAKAGDTITLPAGKYTLNRTLKMTVDRVTIVGAGNGHDPATSTILSFKGAAQSNGFEARFVKGLTLKKFAVEDAVGNAIFVTDSTDVVMDTVRAEWTTDPINTSQMAYGLYPVACDNVLVVNSKAIGTRDAGVYVGQSKNIRVIGNEAYYNVAGIEIENSRNAVVESNYVHDNTGGILVFALPGTYRFADNQDTVVRYNTITNNNQPVAANASGFVTAVPPGTGVLVLAGQNTEVHGNTITNHKTTGVLAVSFQSTGFSFDRRVYDPYLRGLNVYANRITDFGSHPGGTFADPAGLGQVVSGLFSFLGGNGLPQRFAAVVWDGVVDPATNTTGSQGQGGNYSGNLKVCSKSNSVDTPNVPGLIAYENLDLDLLALKQGLSAGPVFPFPPRMDCSVASLSNVTGLP